MDHKIKPTYPFEMATWLAEKSQRVVQSLALISERLSASPFATNLDSVADELKFALYDATKILAFATQGNWKPDDASMVLSEGTHGFEKLLVQYGLLVETAKDAKQRSVCELKAKLVLLLDGPKADSRTELHALLVENRTVDLDLSELSELLDRVTMNDLSWDIFVADAKLIIDRWQKTDVGFEPG